MYNVLSMHVEKNKTSTFREINYNLYPQGQYLLERFTLFHNAGISSLTTISLMHEIIVFLLLFITLRTYEMLHNA